MDFYYQIYQLDGRVENHHLQVEDEDIYLDLINDVRGKCKSLETISKYEFLIGSEPDTMRVSIYADKYQDNDAGGEYLGYIEHYEL